MVQIYWYTGLMHAWKFDVLFSREKKALRTLYKKYGDRYERMWLIAIMKFVRNVRELVKHLSWDEVGVE